MYLHQLSVQVVGEVRITDPVWLGVRASPELIHSLRSVLLLHGGNHVSTDYNQNKNAQMFTKAHTYRTEVLRDNHV